VKVILLSFWKRYPYIDRGLEKVERKIKQEARSRNGTINEIIIRLAEAGGKRLRPALVLTCGGYGGAEEDRLIPVAASVEMIHMATLIHDDVIDDADYRRGIETTHKKWDTHTAIFAGDYLLSKAFGIITDNTVFEDCAKAARAFKLICEGEIEQYYSRNNINTNVRKYLARIRYKTAMLFAMSCYLGANLSEISRSEKVALRNYGLHLGMAFQIKDDLLDFLSSDYKLGKPVVNDLRQGIYTLPVIYMLKNRKISERVRELLEALKFGEQGAVEEIIPMIKQSGAIQKSRELQNRFIAKARNDVKQLKRCKYTDLMEDLLVYVTERTN
jgi:heptaprenyl diphosphate synthase